MTDDARQEPVAAEKPRCRNCPHAIHGFAKCAECDCIGTFRGEPVAIEKPFSNWLFRHAVAREGDWFVCQSCGARASDPNGMSHTAVPVAAAEEQPTLQDYDDTGHHVCRAAEVVCVCGRHIRSVAAAEVLEHKITDEQLFTAIFPTRGPTTYEMRHKVYANIRALFALTPPENAK